MDTHWNVSLDLQPHEEIGLLTLTVYATDFFLW